MRILSQHCEPNYFLKQRVRKKEDIFGWVGGCLPKITFLFSFFSCSYEYLRAFCEKRVEDEKNSFEGWVGGCPPQTDTFLIFTSFVYIG